MKRSDFNNQFYQECCSCMLERHPENCAEYRKTHKLESHMMEGLTHGDVRLGCGKLK